MTEPAAIAPPRDRRLLGAILLALALIGVSTLVLPPGRDQAIFALVADTMATGGFPYADAFDFKPPGIHFLYALARTLGVDAVRGARLLDLVALLVGVAALYRLVRPVSARAAAIAAALFGLGYVGTLGYWDLAQPEGFLITLVLCALLIARDATRGPRLLLAGTLLGAAFVLKYSALPFVLLLPFLPRDPKREDGASVVDVEPLPGRARTAAFLAAGFLAPVIGTLAYLAAGGALGAFREIQTEYLPGYSQLLLKSGGAAALSGSFAIARSFFLARPILLAPALVGFVLIALLDRRRAALAPALGAVLALAGVCAQGKLFHYHWIPLLPFLAWAAGHGVDVLLRRLSRRRAEERWIGGLLVTFGGVLLLVSARPIQAERTAAVRHLLGHTTRDAFWSEPVFGRVGDPDHALVETLRAAAEAKQLTRPGEAIFVWGFEPLLYLEAERRPASRFIYNAAFISPWCPQAWTEEIVTSLRAAPPSLFIVSSNDAIPWVTGVPLDSRAALRFFPDIVELLRTRYTAVREVDRFTFFALEPSARSATPTGGTRP